MQCKKCGTDISLVPKTTLVEGWCYTCYPRKNVSITERVSLDGDQVGGYPLPIASEKELRG